MRKNILFTVIIITLNVMNTFSQNRPSKWGDQGNGTYINPILNSDYSDPDVIRVDNKFYMVASDFHFMPKDYQVDGFKR